MKFSSTLLILGASIFIFGIIVNFLNWFSSGNVGSIEVTAIWATLIGFIMIVGISILRKRLNQISIQVGKKLSLAGKATFIVGACLIVASFSIMTVNANTWWSIPGEPPTMRPIEGLDYAVFTMSPILPISGFIGIVTLGIGMAIFFTDRKKNG